jgi:ribosomal protein S18 acetylase RimI-like enzyme
LQNFFREKSNRFSYQYTQIIPSSGGITGLIIAYSGRLMKSLEFPMMIQLIRARRILGFIRFMKRAIPLVGTEEAKNDEFFISNIAVLPTYQGNGLGKYMLSQAEMWAGEQGFKKISLTVDVENERAFSLYKRIGFNLVERIEIESLKKKIGYNGFHRMQKVLA